MVGLMEKAVGPIEVVKVVKKVKVVLVVKLVQEVKVVLVVLVVVVNMVKEVKVVLHWRKKQGGWGGCSPPCLWKGPHPLVIALGRLDHPQGQPPHPKASSYTPVLVMLVVVVNVVKEVKVVLVVLAVVVNVVKEIKVVLAVLMVRVREVLTVELLVVVEDVVLEDVLLGVVLGVYTRGGGRVNLNSKSRKLY